jgi:outer membrane protein assembly factor BamA
MTGAVAAAALALLLAPAARALPSGAQASDSAVAIATGTVVVPESSTALSSAPVIADTRVERTNVFDPGVPGENWWPFQIANRIRFITRERVVRDELLLKNGDRWDSLKALESERNLRSGYAFRRVEIVKVSRPDGRVDQVVRTQDSWSTNPRIGFGTSGGDSTLSVGLEENNLLGYGKSVGYIHSTGNSAGGRQHSDAYSYSDPRFMGTRLGLGATHARTQDGDSDSVDLSKPYYSLDSDHAVGLSFGDSNAVGTLFSAGAESSKYFERDRTIDAAYGRRLSADRFFIQRVEAGWYEQDDSFSATARAPGTLPGSLPGSRHLSGPTIGYSWVQPRYIKETYIDRMERVEDFNLGNELHARTGYMARGTGSDEDRWIFNAVDRQGLKLSDSMFALAQVGVSGRIFNNRWENGLVTASANYFWKNYLWTRHRTLIAHVEAAQGRRLDRENQIDLGGSSGLRGYRNDSFVGGRALLVNIEDRFFFAGEWLHLVRFGGAAFFESGSVVPEGSGFSPARFRSDVGAGLRAASTRSTSGGVVRLDAAYALNGSPGGPRWIISIKGGQAFSLFNSAAQTVKTSPAPRL